MVRAEDLMNLRRFSLEPENKDRPVYLYETPKGGYKAISSYPGCIPTREQVQIICGFERIHAEALIGRFTMLRNVSYYYCVAFASETQMGVTFDDVLFDTAEDAGRYARELLTTLDLARVTVRRSIIYLEDEENSFSSDGPVTHVLRS